MVWFFPEVLDYDAQRSRFRCGWYGSHLWSMEERPLYPPEPDQFPVYRLLHLPTFSAPSMVRLTEGVDGWRVVCKRSDGWGGYAAGELVAVAEHDLTVLEVQQFLNKFDQCGFWDLPSYEKCDSCDGTQAVVEGVNRGRYHVVDRWSPRGTPYAELVEYLLALGRFQPPGSVIVGSRAEVATPAEVRALELRGEDRLGKRSLEDTAKVNCRFCGLPNPIGALFCEHCKTGEPCC
jgi:hypothetical protein